MTLFEEYRMVKAMKPEALLLFRVGDFYESYWEDAETIGKVLGKMPTKRSLVPMLGIIYHSLESCIQQLVAAGHIVAVCEEANEPRQVRDKRKIERIVTG